MGKFDRAVATAQRLISENGQSVLWRQISAGAAVGTPWGDATVTTIDYTVNMVFFPDTMANHEWLATRPQDGIPRGGVVGLFTTALFIPTVNDVVVRNGKNMTVVSVDQLSPNGQAIYYEVRFNQ
jgi:hypothetical protein